MKCINISDAHKLIHEGKVPNLWNRLKTLVDNGELGEDKVGYLISLQDGFLSIRCNITFYI